MPEDETLKKLTGYYLEAVSYRLKIAKQFTSIILIIGILESLLGIAIVIYSIFGSPGLVSISEAILAGVMVIAGTTISVLFLYIGPKEPKPPWPPTS